MLNLNTYQAVKKREHERNDLSYIHGNYKISNDMGKLNDNNFNKKRPLKNNSQDLYFKGLSFMGANPEAQEPSKKKKPISPTVALLGTILATGLALRLAPSYKKVGDFKLSDVTEFINDHIGKKGNDLVEHLKNSELAKDMVKIEGDTLTLHKKTVPQLIWDGMTYPVTILPGEILNGAVKMLGKVKPLKKWSENTLQTPMFKNIRKRSKIDAQVNTIRGIVEIKEELLTKLNKKEITKEQFDSMLFQRKMKMFDPKTGNYDTKHERALVRVVSGTPPAIFLANDAYNLSTMMDGDPKAAEKEKKARFSQEVSRIGLNAYIMLITMGALQKHINNSKLGIVGMTVATTLVTETYSRLTNGKHITKLTADEARKENEKMHAPEAEIKPVKEDKTNFKANLDNKPEHEKTQKPLLSIDTLVKASAVVIAAGFTMKGVRKYIPQTEEAIQAMQKPFKNMYKNLTSIEKFKMPEKEFNEIIKTLEDNGFSDLATKYKNVAATTKEADGSINLGQRNKKVKPLVDFVIAPFKFVYNTVTLPYNITNKLASSFVKKPPVKETAEQIAAKITEDDIASLAKSIEQIGSKAREKGMTAKEFQSFVNDNFLKAFNVDTMSNVSNADLSNIVKTAATAATLWFLMTDNYNMVMLKSNGNDKEGAETKFRERFVQEGSRLFYSALLIDLFNSTFSAQYHKSLMGVTAIVATNTTLSEMLNRKSVGMPIKSHSKEELVAIEEEQNQATGFLKGYYNFMRRLTGKRPISSYEVNNKDKSQQIAEQATKAVKSSSDANPVSFQNNQFETYSLNKFIKS
ncbi:MAG: hypothetical protein R3Y28_02050 [Candidatus Gastranaerophilales bacterium]